ncbi:sulfotransferase family protein [Desulfocurvus sp. DL9XJH121]
MRIFIGGTGRSGTTVTCHIFTQHPDVLMFMEPRFINDKNGLTDYISGKCDLAALRAEFRTKFLQYLIRGVHPVQIEFWTEFYNQEFMDKAFRDCFTHADRMADAKAFISFIFGKAVAAKNLTKWVEKTPNTVEVCHVLLDIFPDMKYIHSFRDPRDIFCSVRPMDWGPNTVEEFIPWYTTTMQNAWASRAQVPAECYFSFDLADLAANPRKMTEKLFRFSGLDHDEANVAQCAKRVESTKTHLQRWKQELTRQENMAITAYCLPTYEHWLQHRETVED